MSITPRITLAMRMAQIRLAWQERPRRDRRIITSLAVLVGLTVLWFGIWAPINASLDKARQKLPRAQSQLATAQQLWRQVDGLAATARSETPTTDAKTALTLLADRFSLTQSLSGVEAQNQQVSCTLTSVSFETLVQWLAALQREESLFVVSLTLTPLSQPNTLRAELVLARSL